MFQGGKVSGWGPVLFWSTRMSIKFDFMHDMTGGQVEGGGADAVIEGLPVNAATDIKESLFVCDIFTHVGLVKVVDEMKVILNFFFKFL